MKKPSGLRNYSFVFLSILVLCCFLQTVHAGESNQKSEPVKTAPGKKTPARIGQQKAAQQGKITQGREAGHDFRAHHDYAHFTPKEREIWHNGTWRHETFQGRLGWWYVAGGMWYFYEQPIYLNGVLSFPLVVASLAFEAPEVPVIERPVIVQQQPQWAPQQTQFWYYCQTSNPPGYSPYISACPAGWVKVPTQITAPPPPPMPVAIPVANPTQVPAQVAPLQQQ